MLAVVHDPALVPGLIERIVTLVRDEHDPRTGGHVAVVGHVDEEILQRALLNPSVVDGNELEDVDLLRAGREELDAELV
jgi:hypothetical protein